MNNRVLFGFLFVVVGYFMAEQWITKQKGLKYDPLFKTTEKKYGLPAGLLSRVAYQESRYNPLAVSPVGASGLMQFMPATATEYGIDPFNTTQSIDAAGQYLSKLYKKFKRWDQALAAYNWGQGNVSRKGLAKAPAETREYYSSIMRDTGLSAIEDVQVT